MKFKVGDIVTVVPGKGICTPYEFVGRVGVIHEKGAAFDWRVKFTPEEYVPLNEIELELL